VTPADAQSKWDECLSVIEQLAKEFPCPECEGSGNANPENYPYPEPCPECWGRGFQIPEEEDE
jgi:hypothetical protein